MQKDQETGRGKKCGKLEAFMKEGQRSKQNNKLTRQSERQEKIEEQNHARSELLRRAQSELMGSGSDSLDGRGSHG